MPELLKGLSAVFIAHGDEPTLAHTWDMLEQQDFGEHAAEIIVVVGPGSDDNFSRFRDTRERRPDLDVHLITLESWSRPNALQAGLDRAQYRYFTIIHPGERFDPGYLESSLQHAHPNRVSVSWLWIHDGGRNSSYDSSLVRACLPYEGGLLPSAQAARVLVVSGGKFVPTRIARLIGFDADYGETSELQFWMRVAIDKGLKVTPIPMSPGARLVVHGDEVDTQSESVGELSAVERVRELFRVLAWLDHSKFGTEIAALTDQVRVEVHLTTRRLVSGAGVQQEELVSEARALGIVDKLDWRELNRNRARDLVVSWCFPPTADASAAVAARRVVRDGECVDVISHSMVRSRGTDLSLWEHVQPFIGQQWISSWIDGALDWTKSIKRFANDGLHTLQAEWGEKLPYSTLYSRAMWPASHVLAGLIKLEHPQIVWTAEFSDPLSLGIQGQEKDGEWPANDPLTSRFAQAVSDAGFQGPTEANLLRWIECLTYVLADTIMFTNQVQRELMISRIEDPRLRATVYEKSFVDAHPVPPEDWYAGEVPITLDPAYINIGYFGTLYPNRGVGAVLDAMRDADDNAQLRLHVFTNNHEKKAAELADSGYGDHIVFHPALPYIEFLRQCRALDVLLVSDAQATEYLGVNPYLPSKVADYAGSGTDVWAIREPGSPMSSLDFRFTSFLGDIETMHGAVREICAVHRVG